MRLHFTSPDSAPMPPVVTHPPSQQWRLSGEALPSMRAPTSPIARRGALLNALQPRTVLSPRPGELDSIAAASARHAQAMSEALLRPLTCSGAESAGASGSLAGNGPLDDALVRGYDSDGFEGFGDHSGYASDAAPVHINGLVLCGGEAVWDEWDTVFGGEDLTCVQCVGAPVPRGAGTWGGRCAAGPVCEGVEVAKACVAVACESGRGVTAPSGALRTCASQPGQHAPEAHPGKQAAVHELTHAPRRWSVADPQLEQYRRREPACLTSPAAGALLGSESSCPAASQRPPLATLFRDDATLVAQPSAGPRAVLQQLMDWTAQALKGMLHVASAENVAARQQLTSAQAELLAARERCAT